MSEFSSGILFLNQHSSIVQEAAKSFREPFYSRQLNEKWSGFFAESITFQTTPAAWVKNLSIEIPLLLLDVTDDHGWGYTLVHDANSLASVKVNYALDWNMAADLAEMRYPEYAGDLMDKIMTGVIPFPEIKQEVVESTAYRQEIEQQYANINLHELAVFEIAPEVIAELAEILTPEQYLQDYRSQVSIFLDKMQLREFSWISYRYLSRDDTHNRGDD